MADMAWTHTCASHMLSTPASLRYSHSTLNRLVLLLTPELKTEAWKGPQCSQVHLAAELQT